MGRLRLRERRHRRARSSSATRDVNTIAGRRRRALSATSCSPACSSATREYKGDFGDSGGDFKLNEPIRNVLRRLRRRPVVRRRARSASATSTTARPPQHRARRRDAHGVRRHRAATTSWRALLGGYWFRPAPTWSTARSRKLDLPEDRACAQFSEQRQRQHRADLRPAEARIADHEPRLAGRRQPRQRSGRSRASPGSTTSRTTRAASRRRRWRIDGTVHGSRLQAGRQLVRCSISARAGFRRRDRLHLRQRHRAARATATTRRSRSACASRCSGAARREEPFGGSFLSRYVVRASRAKTRQRASPAIARGPYHDVHSPSTRSTRLAPARARAPRVARAKRVRLGRQQDALRRRATPRRRRRVAG